MGASGRRVVRGLLVLGVALAILETVLPLLYLLLTSVKPPGLLLDRPPRLWFPPTVEGYAAVLTESNFPLFFANSVVVTTVATAFALGLGLLGAYAINNFHFPLRRALFFIILLTRMYPPVTTLLPIYFVMRTLGLVDTRTALILVYTGTQLPLVVWVMRTFFAEVPREVQESALIDGCTPAQLFIRIMLPLTTPGAIACAILVFILTWNEFLFALTLTSFNAKTAPVGVMAFIETEGMIQWGIVSVIGVITIFPIVVFALALNRFLIRGLTAGALKG